MSAGALAGASDALESQEQANRQLLHQELARNLDISLQQEQRLKELLEEHYQQQQRGIKRPRSEAEEELGWVRGRGWEVSSEEPLHCQLRSDFPKKCVPSRHCHPAPLRHRPQIQCAICLKWRNVPHGIPIPAW